MVAFARSEANWNPSDGFDRSVGASGFLNHLRLIALSCRTKARSDLFRACALLSVEKDKSSAAHAEALVRTLDQALPGRPVFFRPGTGERSFDEAWLVQLATSLARKDEASTAFLLDSRVKREHRRHIQYLVAGASAAFSLP